mgnify:CR=1 FL=1
MADSKRSVLRFDGATHIVDMGVRTEHRVVRDLTLEAWICATKQVQWAGIVSRIFDTGATESGYGLMLDGSSGIYFGIRTTSNQNFYFSSGPNTLSLNTWHHVAATYDGNQIVIYIDGQARATAQLSGNIDYDPDHNLFIGTFRDNDENHPFPGQIAEVRLWNAARKAEQIQADMRRRLRGSEANLVSYWPLDEGSGDVARDRTARATHGKITGAIWETVQSPITEPEPEPVRPLPISSQQPNILLIVADDCGVDLLRINDRGEVVAQLDGPGGTHIGGERLPNIEKLVQHGMHFSHAWAHPVCAPSRASLFTGLHPWKHGVGFPSEDCVLPSTRPHSAVPIRSLAEVLNPAGYRCGMFGKWDLGGPEKGEKRTAADWGWSRFEGIIGGGLRPQKSTKYFYPYKDEPGADVMRLEHLDSTELEEGAPAGALEERRKLKVRLQDYMKQQCPDYANNQRDIRYYVAKKDIEDRDLGIRRYNVSPLERTHMYATKDQFMSAKDWIKQNNGRPWFVSMTSLAPHDPYHIPPQEAFTIKFKDPKKPTTQELLIAMLQSLDFYIGELINSPEPEIREQLKNTVILFVGDNGTQDDDPDSRGAAPGGKGELLDEDASDKGTHFIGGVHVPMVIADGGLLLGEAPCYFNPAGDSPGTRGRYARPVHIVDFFRTIVDFAGAKAPDDLDSVSLVPTLNRTDGDRRSVNFSQQFAPHGRRIAIHASASDGRYKLSCVRTQFVDGIKEDEYQYSFFTLQPHPSIPSGIKETQIEDYFDEDEYLEAAKKLFVELEQQHLVPAHPGKGITPLKFPKLKIPEVAAYRYVRLLAKSEVNGGAWTSVADFQVLVDGRPLPRGGWTVKADSQEPDYTAQHAVDGGRSTMWHTAWRQGAPVHPHWLRVDLGSPQKVSGFRYQPRQDMPNGRIADYEFQVSGDGENWTTVVSGRFPNTTQEQVVSVLAPNEKVRQSPGVRFVRLVAKSEVSGGAATAVEDFQLLLDGKPLDRSEWAVSVDSQESASENGAARNAIDGQPGTAWVTEWSRRAPKPPHWLSIDLQSPQVFNGFAYQPRTTSASGRIAGYELQVSTNAQTWTTIASGTFANTGNLQTVACKLPRGL